MTGTDNTDKYSKNEELKVKIRLTNENGQNEKVNRDIEKDKRRINLAISLFAVLNVLLLALIVITAIYVFSEKQIPLHDANICVPCEDLRLHPDDNIEGIERVGENRTTCCAKDTEDADALIGYYTDHWLKTKLSSDDRPFTRYECKDGNTTGTTKPTIKLVGRTDKQTADHHKLLWDGNSDLSIVLDHETISHHPEHGFIEIKKSGLYQVYSQVVLDHDMNSHSTFNAPAIYQHTVILIEAGMAHGKAHREQIILKTSNSHCTSRSNRQHITSYLGSVFQLNERDKLAVKVHNKTEVVPVPHMNFFGAHML